MHRITQVEALGQRRQVGDPVVHVVAPAELVRAAVPAALVDDHPVVALQEEQHLDVPVVGRQRPAVTEVDGLTGTPVHHQRSTDEEQTVHRGPIGSSSVYSVDMATRAMQEASFLILTAVADAPLHGYGIIAEVERISQGRLRLRAGTLYAALDRLRLDGLIAVDREEVVASRLRRYYRLTPYGADQLAAEATRLQTNASTALSRLRPAPGALG